MNLAEGGHLTHGSPVNMSGAYYNFAAYGVDPVTHRIDYDKLMEQACELKPKLIVAGASAYPRAIDFKKFREIAEEYAKKIDKAIFPGTQGGPLMHIIAAKAVCLGEALKPEFKTYAEQTVKNAKALAESLTKRGMKLVSGGTDNHLMLLDLSDGELTGKELERRLDEVYITANKNTIPNEQRSPFVTSGVRLGTPAVTTRGLKEADMDVIAECIHLCATDFDNRADAIRAKVTELLSKYPLYND